MKKLKEPNFRDEKNTYCVRCQVCGNENYALNVLTGICTWCGENHNTYN